MISDAFWTVGVALLVVAGLTHCGWWLRGKRLFAAYVWTHLACGSWFFSGALIAWIRMAATADASIGDVFGRGVDDLIVVFFGVGTARTLRVAVMWQTDRQATLEGIR